MISYKKLVEIHEAFANAHFQIKNFGNGERWQVTDHAQESFFKYPLMFLEDRPQRSTDKEWIYSFRIWFVTRVESPEGRTTDLLYTEYKEAKSMMVQCAQDLISWWAKDTNYPFVSLDRNINIETFTDREPDRLTGCYVDMNYSVAFNYNKCILPLDNIPSPENPCQPVLIYEDNVLVATIQSGGRYDYSAGGGSIDIDINGSPFLTDQSTDIDIPVKNTANISVGSKIGSDWIIGDADNFFNGSPINGVRAEGNKTITVFNSNANNVGAVVANSVDELEIEIANSTVSNSDDSYTASVLAEGSLELPDITVTDSDGSTSSFPSVKNVVCTPVNYLNVGGIYLAGADTSYTSGDEANDPPGVGSTWHLLSSDNSWLNEFGNNLRFTGTTGGGYNGSAYVDVNGNPTTKALAYPNDVMLIWNRFNQKLNTVPAVCFNPLASATLTSHLASQPYTIDGKSNWKVMTSTELDEFSRKWTDSNGMLNYPPIDYPYSVVADRLWTRTPAESIDLYYFFTGVFSSRGAKGTSYKTMVTRLYTLTELGL